MHPPRFPVRAVRHGLVALGLAVTACAAQAYESDVHYGLTKWLALRAGFDAAQAEWIALANQRIDGGLMDTLELTLEYACAGRHADVARQVQRRHYPSKTPLPASAEQRAVVAGSEAARAPLGTLAQGLAGKAGLMLVKLGEALHTLQDSWAHQGVPGLPSGKGMPCEPSLASGHPHARGGPDSHAADLTSGSVADALDMARATYEALLAYPPIVPEQRRPAAWAELTGAVQEFARAGSKSEKRSWFVARGLADTSFLQGVSLPDGADPGPLNWSGRKLLTLAAAASRQHDAPTGSTAFFDELLRRWVGEEPVEAVLAAGSAGTPAASGGAPARSATRQLAARLKLWKLRDHGAVAALAHAPGPLTEAQLRAVDRLAAAKGAFIAVPAITDAVFALQASGPEATPLVPYLVRPLPGSSTKFIALMRLAHAPYDSIGWIAEQQAGRWVLVDLVAVVDQ